MPYCARYRSFDLKGGGASRFDLEVTMWGPVWLLRRMLEAWGLVASVQFTTTFDQVLPTYAPDSEAEDAPSPHTEKFSLRGVSDPQALRRLLEVMRNRLLIDIGPKVDECYALGPYSLKESRDAEWDNAKYGELAKRAKFDSDANAIGNAAEELADFASALPICQTVTAVASPPRSRAEYRDVSRDWAQAVATRLEVPIVGISKSRETDPQLPDYGTDEDAGSEDEQERVGRMQDSMRASESLEGQKVLVIDNTIRSGGTLIEAGRALKDAGASAVYGLSLAKNAKYTKGRVSLRRGDWS